MDKILKSEIGVFLVYDLPKYGDARLMATGYRTNERYKVTWRDRWSLFLLILRL